jgi:Rrf2 family transcriptional regulator, cysteine metabolism repressor
MRLITKNTDYAIRALLALAARKGSFRSARDIAQEQGIPYQFLRRVLNALIAAKLVESREGVNGGCRLVVPAAKISLIDVIGIFQGQVRLSECMFRRKLCGNRATCVLRREILRIERLVQDEFQGITIGGLLKELNKR